MVVTKDSLAQAAVVEYLMILLALTISLWTSTQKVSGPGFWTNVPPC